MKKSAKKTELEKLQALRKKAGKARKASYTKRIDAYFGLKQHQGGSDIGITSPKAINLLNKEQKMTNLIHFSKTDLSDFSKEANGFRCRTYKEWWTKEELEEEYHHLGAICEENRIRDEARNHQAMLDFNKVVEETIANGAGDKDTAIRWLVQAEGLELNSKYDLEYFFWGYGLSYEKQIELTKKILDN